MKFYKKKKRFVYSIGSDRRVKVEDWNFDIERTNGDKNVNQRIENVISIIKGYETNQEYNKKPFDFDELWEKLNSLKTSCPKK